MDQCEVAPIARCVQGGCGLGDVFADDGHVADLAVTLTQVEMGQADGARIVGDFRLLQGAVVERDRSRLLAAGKCDAAVEAPEIRVQGLRQVLAQGIRGAAKDRSGLCKIPLQEVRFSQHDANGELVFLGERRGGPEKRTQKLDGDGGLPAFECGARPADYGLKSGVGHERSIQLAT
jgi:hypothetical protein